MPRHQIYIGSNVRESIGPFRTKIILVSVLLTNFA